MAAGVGWGSSQYQWMVSSVTNLAQVLFSGLVLAKIFLRKLNSLRSTCGRRWIEKKSRRLKVLKKNYDKLNGWIKWSHTRTVHTRRVQYAPSRVDGHVFCIPWMTHPLVTLKEEITTHPIPIRVWGLKYNLQQRTLWRKAIYSPSFIYLIWTVAMEELPYRQPPSAIRHSKPLLWRPFRRLVIPGWRTSQGIWEAHNEGSLMGT